MSHPQPPQRQPTPSETDKYARTFHNAALVTVVACPVLALLPPRKLDLYTYGLIGTSFYSANFLLRESTGRSILQTVSGQKVSPSLEARTQAASNLAELQDNLREQRTLAYQSKGEKPAGIADQVHAGRQGKAWVAERDEEVKEAIEEGKGIGDMISDRIWEVWNWGKTKEDDDD